MEISFNIYHFGVLLTLCGLIGFGQMTEDDRSHDSTAVSAHHGISAAKSYVYKDLRNSLQVPGSVHRELTSNIAEDRTDDLDSGNEYLKDGLEKSILLDRLKRINHRPIKKNYSKKKLHDVWHSRALDRRKRAIIDVKLNSQNSNKLNESDQGTGQLSKTKVNKEDNAINKAETDQNMLPKQKEAPDLSKLTKSDQRDGSELESSDTSDVGDKAHAGKSGSGVGQVVNGTSAHAMILSGDSPSVNLTVMMNKIVHKASHTRDVTSATLCVSAILILMFGVVLHSRMWQKRDQWLTLEEVLQNQAMKSELPKHGGKISIKDLIESKFQFIKAHFHRLNHKSQKSPNGIRKNGYYKEVHQSDDQGNRSGSEDELYSR